MSESRITPTAINPTPPGISIGLPFGLGRRLAPLLTGEGLKARAVRGASWTIAGFGFGQVLRLVSNVLLARLLFPEAFGLMVLVTVFNSGLQMFSDIGIGPALIQHRQGRDAAFLRTAFTMQAVRGLVLTLVGLAMSWPASRLFEMPELTGMLAVSSFCALFSGFCSTRWYMAHRDMALRRITAIELLCQVVVVIVSVGLALVWCSAWVLVIGLLLSSAVRTVLSHLMLPGEADRFGFDWTSFHGLMGVGRWVFLNTVIGFFARNLDRIYIGMTYTQVVLGVYGIAYRFIEILQSIVIKLYDRILFPSMADALRRDDDAMVEKYFSYRRYALAVWAIVVVAVHLFGGLLIGALYDDRYRDAEWILRVGSLALWPMALTQSTSSVMLAAGQPRYFVFGSGARLICLALLLPVANGMGGLHGTVMLIAFADIFRYFGLAFGVRHTGMLRWRDDFLVTLWFLVLLSAAFVIRSATLL